MVLRRITMESIFLAEVDSVNDIRLTDVLFLCSLESLAKEDHFLFEKIFKPNNYYIGEKIYEETFSYSMSAPEMLLSENFLSDSRRNYND